jgi:hypothetical protein
MLMFANGSTIAYFPGGSMAAKKLYIIDTSWRLHLDSTRVSTDVDTSGCNNKNDP